MIKNIVVPNTVKTGMSRLKTGFNHNYKVFGSDIETKPFNLIGFENTIIPVDKNTIHKEFLKICDEYSYKEKCNIVFFHNLRFDIQVIFMKFKDKFFDSSFYIYFDKDYNEISLEEYIKNSGIVVDIKIGRSCFATIHFSKNRYLKIIDSFQFFKNSLKTLSISLNLNHKKLDDYNENSEYNDFVRYLKNDVFTVKDLGIFITDFHKKYDVSISVSIANLSGKIFRHKFIREQDNIPFIDSDWVKKVEYSYHGGKNGFYLDRVIKIPDVYEYDLISAYPYAMCTIPNFNHCEYIRVNEFVPELEGVYIINGIIREHKYNLLYTHDFKEFRKDIVPAKRDILRINNFDGYYYVKNLCITSYEFKTALKYDLIDIDLIQGYLVKPNEEELYNPFKEYVNHFYHLKEITPKTNPDYLFYKLLLNSLYGKTVQNVDYAKDKIHYQLEDGTIELKDTIYKAGSMYNPLIATLITGFVRSKIYDLERKYNSLHTSTDSIKSLIPPIQISEIGNRLGDLTVECFGDCLFFRNKTYIHFSDKIKYAHHGFYGKVKLVNGKIEKGEYTTIENLISMYIMKENKYKQQRMFNIKESRRRKDKNIIPCEIGLIDNEFKVIW